MRTLGLATAALHVLLGVGVAYYDCFWSNWRAQQ